MKNYNNKTLFVVTRVKGKSWDLTKSMREQNNWNEHANFMNKLAKDGLVILGGPINENGEILLIMDSTSENEIRNNLKQDCWSEMNILEIKDIRPWTILLQNGLD